MDKDIEEMLPPGVAISWGLVKPSQRGPKRELSIEQIVQAAIQIADEDGLAGLSMNRLATSLGFTTMSLYRYVPSKDDLLLLMQEAVSDIELPPLKSSEAWRDSMREYVWQTVQVLREHAWFADIPISGVPITPNQLRFVDFGLRTMRGLPLNDYEKMSVVLLLSSYARSVGIVIRDMERTIQAGSSSEHFSGRKYSAALKQLVTPERFPDLHAVVMSGVYTEENAEQDSVDNDFAFGLERILDGIEKYMKAKKTEGRA